MEFNEFEIRMLVSMPAKKWKKIHKITPPNCEFFYFIIYKSKGKNLALVWKGDLNGTLIRKVNFLTAIPPFRSLSENFAEKFWPYARKLVFFIYAAEISANWEHCTPPSPPLLPQRLPPENWS